MALPGVGPVGGVSGTLAEQLRSRLDERRKSKDDEPIPVPDSAGFVPENLATDIQKAVKLANENSKLIDILH